MLQPRPLSSREHIADIVSEDSLIETGVESVHDGTLRLFGEKGTQALDDLNAEFTVDAIEVRRKAAALAAAEAQIDRNPGAFTRLTDRAQAMNRFVQGANQINQTKGAGAGASAPNSDFRERYQDETHKVLDGMERKAYRAKKDMDIARRILTGEAALLGAGFSDIYAMATRKYMRDKLEPLKKTGDEAIKARADAIEETRWPKSSQ